MAKKKKIKIKKNKNGGGGVDYINLSKVKKKNKWYYVSDKEKPHMAIVEGFATSEFFDDKSWFNFVI